MQGQAFGNRLLDALPGDVLRRWAPVFVEQHLPAGHVLLETGTDLLQAVFPSSSIVAICHLMRDGSAAEVAVVGNEGLVGLAWFMGGEITPNRAVVREAGKAFSLPASLVQHELVRNGPLLHLFLRYTQALMTQMAQTAVCNRQHTPLQRLCRRLLVHRDLLEAHPPVDGNGFDPGPGANGASVAGEIAHLQREGIVRCEGGRITAIDWAGLEARCCECYGIMKHETDRLL